MSDRAARSTLTESEILSEGWQVVGVPRGAWSDPAAADAGVAEWLPARVPGTAASALRDAGRWSVRSEERDFDDDDWWFRVRFGGVHARPGERVRLRFEGLATIARIWLNGELLADVANMFLSTECDVTERLREENSLLIRCASVRGEIERRRGRPRWRTPMVAHQQLRWVRTTLLGRTPGWSPPAAPVGPWRPIRIVRVAHVECVEKRLCASIHGAVGRVDACMEIRPEEGTVVTGVRLVVARGGAVHACDLRPASAAQAWSGRLEIPSPTLWFPHTHGMPALYEAALEVRYLTAGSSAPAQKTYELGELGFRRVDLVRDGAGFAIRVNGAAVFVRGACWTPIDPVSLQATQAQLRAALADVAAAGMNMVRVAGPLVYESDEFLALCDSLGILVWQDFMFANMDYPLQDPSFAALCEDEVRQALRALRQHPCIALVCGNSEVEQQAAMSGAPAASWHSEFFHGKLPSIVEELCPGLVYWPSSAHGGAFPHQNSVGTCSYYGVGAYLLPLTDARRSELKFAAECLAFANVPESSSIADIADEPNLRCHDPRWKRRVPRDRGAGWDFDDVRDHYLGRLFGQDSLSLRYADHDRYLHVSRVVTGEVMAASFVEWRRERSDCGGALIWFWRDLWAGAGWGVIDASGRPKAPYHYLKRVLQPRAVAIADEGTNGIVGHVWNDCAEPLRARLDLDLYRHSERVGRRESLEIDVPGRSSREIPLTDFFGAFLDLSYAYRFGPPIYDLLCLRLAAPDGGTTIAEAFHFPLGLPLEAGQDLGLTALGTVEGGERRVRVETRRFAQCVQLDLPGFVAEDQYFHLAPNAVREIRLRPVSGYGESARGDGHVHALNGRGGARIVWQS